MFDIDVSVAPALDDDYIPKHATDWLALYTATPGLFIDARVRARDQHRSNPCRSLDNDATVT